MRPVIQRQVARQADRNLVLDERARAERIVQHHELAATRVTLGFAEVAFAIDFGANLFVGGLVGHRAKHDDAAGIAARKTHGCLELFKRILDRGVQAKLHDEVDLSGLRVVVRGRAAAGRGGVVPHACQAVLDRADRDFDARQGFKNFRHINVIYYSTAKTSRLPGAVDSSLGIRHLTLRARRRVTADARRDCSWPATRRRRAGPTNRRDSCPCPRGRRRPRL